MHLAFNAEAELEGSGHAAGGAGHGEPNPMKIDPDLAIFTVIVFVVLLTVL